MKNTVKISALAGFTLLTALSLLSCATYKQNIELKPFDAQTPVSASNSLFINGATLDPNSYRVLDSFEFTKKVEVPLINSAGAEFAVSEEIKKLLKEKGGDAVVAFKFQTVQIDDDSPSWIALERYFGILGGALAIVGLVLPSIYGLDNQEQTLWVGTGAGMAVLGIGGSFLHEALGTIDYTYKISGKIVKINK